MTAIRFRNRKCEQIVSKTGEKCVPIVKGIPNTVKRVSVAETASSRLDILKQRARTFCPLPEDQDTVDKPNELI